MAQFLQYSDVSNQIQDEMAGQAPSETKIARAVDAEFRNLKTKYNIEATLRSIDIVVDTSPVLISSIVHDNDVDSVYGLYQDDIRFTQVSLNDVYKNDNQYCVYYEDGKMYLAVNPAGSFVMKYYTTSRALDDEGNYLPAIIPDDSVKILLPEKYLDLICLGAMKRLFYQAVGESDQIQVAIVRNRYDAELLRLGLSNNAKKLNADVNKVKIRVQW